MRLVILSGHKGSGKTTLCRRMKYDLDAASLPAHEFLDGPHTIHVEELCTATRRSADQ